MPMEKPSINNGNVIKVATRDFAAEHAVPVAVIGGFKVDQPKRHRIKPAGDEVTAGSK